MELHLSMAITCKHKNQFNGKSESAEQFPTGSIFLNGRTAEKKQDW